MPPQVISRYSGYGRTGGFRSRKWHQIYTLHNHQPGNRDCSGRTPCTRQAPHRGPAVCGRAFAAYVVLCAHHPAPGRGVCDLTQAPADKHYFNPKFQALTAAVVQRAPARSEYRSTAHCILPHARRLIRLVKCLSCSGRVGQRQGARGAGRRRRHRPMASRRLSG